MYNENRQPASRTLPTFPEDEDPETEEGQQNSDEEMQESSPDLGGYDAVEQCNALIVDALSELSECLDSTDRSLFSLSDAVEYAFNSKSDSRLPSEPSQWKNIKGRPDAALWHAAAIEEFKALMDNGTFEPDKLPPRHSAIGCH